MSGGGLTFYFSVRAVLLSEFDSALRMKAQALGGLVKWEDDRVEFEFADELMPSFERKDRPEYFQIWLGAAAADGESVERSVSLGEQDLPDRAGAIDSPEFWDQTLPGGVPGRAVGIRFRPEEESADRNSASYIQHKQDEVKLVVAVDRMDLDASIRAIGVTLVAVGAAILAFTILIVSWVVRRGLRPLDSLGARVAAIDAATLSARIPADSMPAELQPICERLNELLNRLDESFRRERRFSANVAHELRTPIAELRSMAEVALKYPDDAGDSKEKFRDALDIAVQMENRVASLILLVRCQGGQERPRRETVKIAELVEEIWRPMDAAAKTKGLVVEKNIQPSAVLETDRNLARTIIHNLLTNAVEYSPVRGRVNIFLSTEAGQFEFRVENTCDGLTSEDLPHLCEPFWRKDAVRSDASHSGLGLSLASECARILSMKLTAELSETRVLRMRLTSS